MQSSSNILSSSTFYVGGLSLFCSEQHLHDLFARFGAVNEVSITYKATHSAASRNAQQTSDHTNNRLHQNTSNNNTITSTTTSASSRYSKKSKLRPIFFAKVTVGVRDYHPQLSDINSILEQLERDCMSELNHSIFMGRAIKYVLLNNLMHYLD